MEDTFPSRQVLSGCMVLYFRHFSPTLPIFDQSRFTSREAHPVLLLAMSAIGALYSKAFLKDLAIALNELARRSLVFLTEKSAEAVFNIPILQAHLLQAMFGFFSGSRRLYLYAEITRSHIITSARRMNLLRSEPTSVAGLDPQQAAEAIWLDERKRRLGWAVVYLDSIISTVVNGQSLFSLPELQVPLPCVDEDWEAGRQSGRGHDDAPFPAVLRSLLAEGRLPQMLSPFANLLVGQTLYR